MPPEFEPLRIYDVPGVLAAQILEGEASFATVRDTFLRPNALTPEQRSDLGDRFAAQQRDPLSRAMIGVATNPWIWLGFLTSPVGSKALQAGKSLFSVSKEYSAFVRKGAGWLDSLRSPMRVFDGTALPEVGLGIAEDIQSLNHFAKTWRSPGKVSLQEAEERLYQRVNDLIGAPANKPVVVPGPGKGFSAVNYAPGTPANELLRKMEFALSARSLNLDGSQGATKVVRKIVNGKVVSSEEPVEILFEKAGIDAILDEIGAPAYEYLGAAGRSKQWSFVQMLGDEAHFEKTGLFKADDGKLERLAGAFLRSSDGEQSIGALGSTMYGKDAVLSLIGHKRFQTLMDLSGEPKAVARQIRSDLEELITPTSWGEQWGSRNLIDVQPVQKADGTFGKLLPPDPVARNAMLSAPWAASQPTRGAGRAIPLDVENAYIHIEDLDEFSGLLTEQGRKHRNAAAAYAQEHFKSKGDYSSTFGVRLRFTDAHEKYTSSVAQATAMETRAASQAMLRADTATVSYISPNKEFNKLRVGSDGMEVGVRTDLSKAAPEIQAKISPATLIDKVYGGLDSATMKQRLREVFLPNALNSAGPNWIVQFEAQLRAKESMRWFAESTLGRGLKSLGGEPRRFVEKLEAQASFDGPLGANLIQDGLTRWLYASHLGFNPSSVLLNLSQPLLLAASVASPDDVVKAYGDAITEMSKYAARRAQIPSLRLTAQQSSRLLEESFEGVAFQVRKGELPKNLLGLGPDFNDLYDTAVQMNRGAGRSIIDLSMKGFEKSEQFNRAVTYHILKRAYSKAGRNLDDVLVREQFASDARRFVLETQFGASPLNTPDLFQRTFLRNPLLRMFMTFPLRSATATFDLFPTLGESGRAAGAFNFFRRTMATSAFIYEAGKGLAGVDLSRGLAAEAAFSLVGGGRLLEDGNEVVPIPPVVSIPIDFVRGVAGEDMRLLANSLARSIPGGIALNRAIGVGPDLDLIGMPDLVGKLQTTYVDYNNPTPEGLYPYYDGMGSLIDYRSGPEILLRAAGVDFNAWNAQGGLDNYLNRQRDEVNSMKQRYRQALAQGNVQQAEGIASQFQQKFGVPLQLSRSQMEQYATNRTSTRTERVLKRLPQEVRPQYEEVAKGLGFGTRSMTDGLSPEAKAYLQAEMQQIRQALESVGGGANPNQTFEPY